MRSAIATATRISKTSLTSVDWRNLQGRHRSVVRLPLADPGTMYTAVLNRAAGSRTQYAILRLKHEHLLHTALFKTLKSFLNHHHPSWAHKIISLPQWLRCWAFLILLWSAIRFSGPWCTHTAHELRQSSPPEAKTGKRRCLGGVAILSRVQNNFLCRPSDDKYYVPDASLSGEECSLHSAKILF